MLEAQDRVFALGRPGALSFIDVVTEATGFLRALGPGLVLMAVPNPVQRRRGLSDVAFVRSWGGRDVPPFVVTGVSRLMGR